MMLSLVAFNLEILTLFPQYASYGSQTYRDEAGAVRWNPFSPSRRGVCPHRHRRCRRYINRSKTVRWRRPPSCAR
jgi:hypothetical protein